MRKKLIGILLAFVLAFGSVVVSDDLQTTTYAETSGDYKYEILEDDTAKITEYNGDEEKLEIPSSIEGKKVTVIGENAFAKCDSLETVILPEGLIQIEKDAFFTCNLKSVSIPKTVTSILDRAFCGCSFTVDNENPSYTSVDGSLFNKEKTSLICYGGLSDVTSYDIPEGVTVIGDHAFYACGLTEVVIPESIESIGKNAFCFSSQLKSVVLPKATKKIGREAFYGCDSLKSIKIQNKLCEIYASEDTINDTAVIYGYAESTAQTYADTYSRTFKALLDADCVHQYKTVTTKATLTKNGSIIKKCTKCEYIVSKKTIYYPKTIKLSKSSYVYDGKIKKPTVSVKDSNGKTVKSSNYTVVYPKLYRSTGRYTITIKFKGNYTGTAKRSFTIRPKAVAIKSITKKTKGFLLKWEKATGTMTGYQIQYATNSKFTGATTVNVKKGTTVSKLVKNLEGQTKYYVRIRTYKTVNGVNIYGVYSKTVSVIPDSGYRYTYKPGFYYDVISKSVEKRMTGKSYKENSDIKLSDLRYVKVKHYGYDGKVKTGELVVNKKIAEKTVKIFYELYQKKYKIQKMYLVDNYGADDIRSMTDNNSSAFNYRVVEGSTKLSNHAYGLAIDINPMVNPYVKGDIVSPTNGIPYAERDVTKCTGKYKNNMIHKGDVIYNIFKKYGFTWGGDWKYSKDYQHFEYNK